MPRPLHQSPVLPSPSDPLTPQSHPYDQPIFHHSGRNIISLLARREISPKTRHLPKRRWGEPKGSGHSSFGHKSEAAKDARRGLISWVEEESLWQLSAEYSPLMPPPRSTIAAAFSTDGKSLASTHGDHTVKIIDSRTGRCLKVLSGHRRTPWVVRFHPIHPEIVASGSLDHEVRLWDANTSECIGSRDFLRPIASLAFHAKGEFLAVASGHKLYLWHYNRKGESSYPTVLLKTKRSLRAVHFHPHGAPYLLTAEVNDLNYSDPSMARATSLSYLHYPPPSVFLTTAHSSGNRNLSTEHSLMSLPFMFLPSFARDEMTIESPYSNRPVDSTRIQAVFSAPVLIEAEFSAPVPIQAELHAVEQYDYMEASSVVLSNPYPATGGTELSQISHRNESSLYETTLDAMEPTEVQSEMGTLGPINNALPGTSTSGPESIEVGQPHQFIPSIIPTRWELPFFQGWLPGQSQSTINPVTGGTAEHLSSYRGVDSGRLTPDMSTYSIDIPVASSAVPGSIILGIHGRSGFGHRFPHFGQIPVSESEHGLPSFSTTRDMIDPEPIINRIQTELATSLAEATAVAEIPCTVNLRIWSHDIKNACVRLSAERCKLSIPHAVLCSEMGAHFSPCGRYLAACVACMLPQLESDYGLQTQVHQGIMGAAPESPTRHSISGPPVMYELRIYSLENATFGSVLVSRAIRAAHCLTSIQFSPTSEHILLAYGRRHSSLLKSIVIDGETPLPIYTILEVYRVSDLEVVRVIPSAEDEVNVACFHPLAGGGLVYGTKEGKLRILQYDGGVHLDSADSNLFLEENMAEVQTYALEC